MSRADQKMRISIGLRIMCFFFSKSGTMIVVGNDGDEQYYHLDYDIIEHACMEKLYGANGHKNPFTFLHFRGKGLEVVAVPGRLAW